MNTRLTAFVAAHLAIFGLVSAQEKDPWIGKQVFTQFGAVLRVGNDVVDDEGRIASLKASGYDRRQTRIYMVEHVKGEWLWLKHEKSGIAGWVQSKYVIPYEQAIDFYTKQISVNPTAALYSYRGSARKAHGQIDLAISDFDEAIRLDPKNPIYWSNRGNAWYYKPNYEQTLRDYNEAIRLDPKFAEAYLSRGIAWYDIAHSIKKNYEVSIADFNEAIKLNPRYTIAIYRRGLEWAKMKEYEKAIADFKELVRIDPNDSDAHLHLAWILAACPEGKFREGKKAIEAATRACELTAWKYSYGFRVLAAAYAESGDFDKAVEWQEKANELYSEEDKKKWQESLELYRSKKPYRDES